MENNFDSIWEAMKNAANDDDEEKTIINEENGYICLYKDKRAEVYADSSYAAQKKAQKELKVSDKNRHMISVTLAEKDVDPETGEGEQVVHTATEAKDSVDMTGPEDRMFDDQAEADDAMKKRLGLGEGAEKTLTIFFGDDGKFHFGGDIDPKDEELVDMSDIGLELYSEAQAMMGKYGYAQDTTPATMSEAVDMDNDDPDEKRLEDEGDLEREEADREDSAPNTIVLTNDDHELLIRARGKLFRVGLVTASEDEGNAFMEANKGMAFIDSDNNGLHYMAAMEANESVDDLKNLPGRGEGAFSSGRNPERGAKYDELAKRKSLSIFQAPGTDGRFYFTGSIMVGDEDLFELNKAGFDSYTDALEAMTAAGYVQFNAPDVVDASRSTNERYMSKDYVGMAGVIKTIDGNSEIVDKFVRFFQDDSDAHKGRFDPVRFRAAAVNEAKVIHRSLQSKNAVTTGAGPGKCGALAMVENLTWDDDKVTCKDCINKMGK